MSMRVKGIIGMVVKLPWGACWLLDIRTVRPLSLFYTLFVFPVMLSLAGKTKGHW